MMAAIVDLLPPEARRKREPTPEELARAYPSGHDQAEDEDAGRLDRRPGED